MLLNWKDSVEETLNFCFAMIELIPGYTLGMNTHLVDHATRGMLEVGIILEKVSMTEDVRCYKCIL